MGIENQSEQENGLLSSSEGNQGRTEGGDALDQGAGGSQEGQEAPSRKDVIAAALEEHSEEGDAPAGEGAGVRKDPAEASQVETGKKVDLLRNASQGDGKNVPGDGKQPRQAGDNAPASWKAEGKAAWKDVPLAARQEILRRDRETAQLVTHTETLRNFATAVGGAIDPFMPRLKSLGIQPHVAVERLLRMDTLLATSAPAQKAAAVVKLIKDYGIDINELDRALANGGDPGAGSGNPGGNDLERLLTQHLAPVHQFMQTQQQREQERSQQEDQSMQSQIDAMAADDRKYPYFNDVRETMADIVELSAKKGVYVSIEEAYNKACQLDPDISQQVQEAQANATRRAAAVANDARARRALSASRSVQGSRTGAPTGSLPQPTDRRGTIAAAFETYESR